MRQFNPKPLIGFSPERNGNASWPDLDPIPEPRVSSDTLRLALEAEYAETQRLHQHLHRLVKSFPLPALLYNRKGRIVTVNQEAHALMGGVDWKKTIWQVQDLWSCLEWPPTPFTDWKWNGGLVSAWDCPLGDMDQPSSLRIRYITYQKNGHGGEPNRAKRLASLGEEVGRLAHDIRNPLASIEWFATLLGRDPQSGTERRDLADQLLQSIRSLDGLVSNILTLGTPLKREPQCVNLSRLLDEVERLAIYHLKAKRLIIHRQEKFRHLEIRGHEALLTQAVLNVLLNAIQASSPDGHIEIQCRQSVSPDTGGSGPVESDGVTLKIRDEGCGMSEDELTRVFQPFYSKRRGGTGLGLAIVEDIIHAHQGRIALESQIEKGTTVNIFLPQ